MAMVSLIGMIVVLVLILAVFGCIFYAVHRSKEFSRQTLGTDDLKEGFRQVEEEYAKTPKSVSAMTSLYLPKIKRDFPEFQYDEMKVRAENVLTSYLLALDSANPGALKEGNRELRDKLEMKIQMLRGAGTREHYGSIKLHRTEISDYKKRNGRCIITFQTAVQYYHTLQKEDGTILKGSRDRLCQAKYNTDVIYIQDRNLIEEERDFSLGINCPNCGAPISGLGSKVCAYCGTPIVELNIYAWSFSNVTEV